MFIQNLSYLENIEYNSDCSGSFSENEMLRAVDGHLRWNDAMITNFDMPTQAKGFHG